MPKLKVDGKMYSKWPIEKLGKHVFQEKETVGDVDSNDFPVFGVTNVKGVTVTGKKVGSNLSKYKRLKPNRFVYNPYRINVGSIGLSSEEQDGIVSPAYVVFGAKKTLYPKYLYHFLKSNEGHVQIKFYGDRGTVRQALRFMDLCKMEIPLPPFEEQKRIVVRIKRLMHRIELARTILRQLNEENQALIDSLISSILEEIKDKYSSHLMVLSEACKLITDGTHDTPTYVDEGVPLLTAKNVFFDRIDKTNVRFISQEDHEEICKRCPAEKGDVLFINIGATTGTVKKIDIDLEFSLKNVALLKPNLELLNPDFLILILRGPAIKNQIKKKQSQTCQPFLSLRDLRSLEATIPPLSEQRRCISYINSLQKKIEEIRKLRAEIEKGIEELIPSILDKAFRGEL